MEKLRRYYNQNRKKFLGIIIIVIFVLLLIQLANFYVKESNKISYNNSVNEVNQTEESTNSSVVISNRSAVTGEIVSTDDFDSEVATIDTFISYCNNQEVQNAYDMLTDECKENMYTTVDLFRELYYNDNFGGEEKNVSIENWSASIYKVDIMEDSLATGKSNDGYSKQDYITVKKVDNEYKLNINNYIGYTEINKTTSYRDITMEVKSKNTYMEYEEYTITVTNNTDYQIILDSLKNVKTIYLEDGNGVEYSAYNHELTDAMMEINAGHTKELTIKFYSSYVSTKNIKNIVFSNVILVIGDGVGEEIEFKATV